jgi:hypothetical protein
MSSTGLSPPSGETQLGFTNRASPCLRLQMKPTPLCPIDRASRVQRPVLETFCVLNKNKADCG